VPQSVWTGALSFGLVTIPVRLFPATEPTDVRFHLVDPSTGRRIRHKRVVEDAAEPAPAADPDDRDALDERDVAAEPPHAPPADRAAATSRSTARQEREVPFDELLRGYEVEPGRYVTFEREELEAVRPTRSATIDLEDFVPLDEIDPVFFAKAYYLVPHRDSEHPYAVLLRAMQRTGLAAIGRFVLRTKPHLVAIRPIGEALGLETLYFGDEVRPADRVVPPLAGTDVPDREVALAEQLIDVLATDWDPSRYTDAYRHELERMIAERTPAAPVVARDDGSRSHLDDLMTALRESVEAAKQAQPARTRRKTAG
jgi:DNA end-binding protein Ku